MHLILPDFTDEALEQLTACAVFHSDDPASLSGVGELRLQARYSVPGGSAWIRLILDVEEDGLDAHFHFDVGRDRTYEDLDGFTTIGIEELNDYLRRFSGLKMDVQLRASYSVRVDELPRRGLVSALLDVDTESYGYYLRMTGATLDITGDTFTRLRWEINHEDECVEVTLSAATTSEFRDEYLSDFVDVMREGLACFVLDTGEARRKYAASRTVQSTRNLPEIAEA